MNRDRNKSLKDLLETEYRRGVNPVTDQAMPRKLLTARLKELSGVINKYSTNKRKEEERRKMSSSFERKICKKCNGHGELEDGEPCPECGGTGLAEKKDDRIHPRGKEIPKSPKVFK